MKKPPLSFVTVLVSAVLSTSILSAAEPVQWTDLPKQIGPDKSGRVYTIVARNGKMFRGRHLYFSPTEVNLDSATSIPREELAEIRIRHDRPFWDAVCAPIGKMIDGDGGEFLLVFLWPITIPAMVGITAATAPVTITVEGIRRLLPSKVIKVAP